LEVGSFSYWFDKPWFHTEGRLDAVLIIPSSWGSQLGGHLHAIKQFFGTVAGEKEDFWKGGLSLPIFYFVTFFLYFIFACIFLSKIQKISSFIVVISTCLLLVLLEWVLLRTPSCVILLASTTMILSALLLRYLLLRQFFMRLNLLC
jgi:hypothetical protein